jgi:hypothetical protein
MTTLQSLDLAKHYPSIIAGKNTGGLNVNLNDLLEAISGAIPEVTAISLNYYDCDGEAVAAVRFNTTVDEYVGVKIPLTRAMIGRGHLSKYYQLHKPTSEQLGLAPSAREQFESLLANNYEPAVALQARWRELSNRKFADKMRQVVAEASAQ